MAYVTQPHVTRGEGASTEGLPRALTVVLSIQHHLVDDWYEGAQSTVNGPIPRHGMSEAVQEDGV